MSPEAIAAIISGAGVALSLMGSSYVAGKNQGANEVRLSNLESTQRNIQSTMATMEQLAGVKEDLAEIKGMFRMTLRTDDASH